MKYLVVVAIALMSTLALADAPTTDSHWQWNRNVSIKKIYTYWDSSDTRVILDNGEVCYIVKDDKQLFSMVMAMQAQKAKGEFVCQLANSRDFEGKTARRLHRLMTN